MKVNVKILRGEEATLEVSHTDPVLALKRNISLNMNISVDAQRLVFKGKTMTDNCCLHDYGVKDGDKIHLFVKRKYSETKPSSSDFWKLLSDFLKQHFTNDDVEKVIETYTEDFDSWLKQLSLDDIERISKVHLNEQASNKET